MWILFSFTLISIYLPKLNCQFMKKFTFLFFVFILFVQDSKSFNNTEETPKNKAWTSLGIDFISMHPNRHLYTDNFFSQNINPGIGVSANFTHVPKYIGFFGEAYYQANKVNLKNTPYQEYQNIDKFISSGIILGMAGLYDVFKNGDLILVPKAGVGFGNIRYPKIDNGYSKRYEENISRSIVKQLGINTYVRLNDSTYVKFGYDLRWTTLNFEAPINPEKAYTDKKIAMNVINLGFNIAF
jgi:hypothetical protein